MVSRSCDATLFPDGNFVSTVRPSRLPPLGIVFMR